MLICLHTLRSREDLLKAAVLHVRGGDGVAVTDCPMPEAQPGRVRLRMLAASVNRVDLYMRDNGAGITHTLPQIMGVDGVGVVMDAAPGLAVGDVAILYPYEVCGTCPHCLAGDQPLCLQARIFGEHRDGTFAEVISAPATSVLRLAPGVDIAGAAALGVAGLTAWRMVFGKVALQPGMRVLVQGVGGAVAQAAAMLAQMAGCRVMVTTTGAAKIAAFLAQGFDVIDYATDPIARRVQDLTSGAGADLVIDTVGAATWDQSLRAAKRGGAIVTCGATTGSAPSADLQRLFIRQLSVHGSTLGSLAEFARLIACFEAGHFVPQIDCIYPLDQINAALVRAESKDRLGKVIVQIAPWPQGGHA
jgi:NADPH:quinone reductase-like Zn-dependent oxidoreductase